MIEQRHLSIGQPGVQQIQVGDMPEITLQGRHRAQMSSQWHTAQVQRYAMHIAEDIHILWPGVLPALPDRFKQRVS
ncbi:hypothetical protein D3C76_1821680 [compost metagenome]